MVPLYFGVELEFCLSYILPGMKNPDHESDKLEDKRREKKHRVTLAQLQDLECNTDAAADIRRRFLLAAAREHISQRFNDAKLPYREGTNDLGDIDSWSIGVDQSIELAAGDPRYFWFPMEITSPAYRLTPKSLEAVAKVFSILSEEFLRRTNRTCGLHVHFSFGKDISDENRRWNLERLQKLVMFFWTFGPYFEALHSDKYLSDTFYAQPMQKTSRLAIELYAQNEQPTEDWASHEGLERLKNTTSVHRLFELVSNKTLPRYMAVSLFNVRRVLCLEMKIAYWASSDAKKNIKPTVEFRQHEGTLDSKRVGEWIQTLAGVIRSVERNDIAEYSTTLLKPFEEIKGKSENVLAQTDRDKFHNSQDIGHVATEEKPIPILKLLEKIGRKRQAEYYRFKVFRPASEESALKENVEDDGYEGQEDGEEDM